jgi:hypothetical protein
MSRRTLHPIATATAPLVVLALALVLGCDDKRDTRAANSAPQTPQQESTKPAAATAPIRPTTQELLEAPRKPLTLGALKLTLDVPPGWKITTLGTGSWLEGPTPGGEVRIQLASQGAPLKVDSIYAMEKRAREDAAKHADVLEVIPLRDIGGLAKKMERREIQRNLVINIPDDRDPKITRPEKVDRVDWTVLAFLPDADQFNINVLSFSGLSLQQYQKDREFLEHVLNTLHYTAVDLQP